MRVYKEQVKNFKEIECDILNALHQASKSAQICQTTLKLKIKNATLLKLIVLLNQFIDSTSPADVLIYSSIPIRFPN